MARAGCLRHAFTLVFPVPEHESDGEKGGLAQCQVQRAGTEQRRYHARHHGADHQLRKGLQRRRQASLMRVHVQHRQRQDREDQRHAHAAQENRHHRPRQQELRRQCNVADVQQYRQCAKRETDGDLAGGRGVPGHAPGQERAGGHAADGRNEQPSESPLAQMQMLHHEHRRRGDVQEDAAEADAAGQRQAQETRIEADAHVVAHQHPRRQRHPRLDRMRFRQEACGGRQQHQCEHHQEPEDQRPTRTTEQDPAADDRRDRRGDAEQHRHLAHQPLRVMAVVKVADHRAADDHADTRRQALQRAERQQRGQVGGQRAADRGADKHHQAAEDHPLAAPGIGQRAVRQAHQAVEQQVHADGLLHRHLVHRQALGQLREGREDGVDRERTEHGQAGEQQGHAAGGRSNSGGHGEGVRQGHARHARRAPVPLQQGRRQMNSCIRPS
ncbi:hypothetical protein G6F57_015223 [Rhizopus arrhizus]|nr:hypothetical protein G6F57_015223 [Rhizopus arrhizus]